MEIRQSMPFTEAIGAQAVAVREQVRHYIAEYFMASEPLCASTLLVDDLGADSLDLLQVAYTLNEMFDIEIDVETLPKILSVGGACDLVVQLRSR